MRKDTWRKRNKNDGDATANSSDASDAGEADNLNGAGNPDPLSADGGSLDPFDSLLNSKDTGDERTVSQKSANGDSAIESTGNEDTDEGKIETENDANNGDTATEGDDENAAYEVEDIVDHKYKGKKKLYKIRWKNFGPADDTWEPELSLDCPEIVEKYLETHPDERPPKKEKKPKKEKRVKIILPGVPRDTPKRIAAERKAIIEESDSESEQKETAKKNKKAKPKGGKNNKKKGTSQPIYEVEKIVDDSIQNGKKYFRIRWKGYGAKDDTWEPQASLSCPDKIKQYQAGKKKATANEDYEVEKIFGEKIEKGKRFFYVKWKGYPDEENTWEPEQSMDCPELIQQFRNPSSGSGSKKRTAKAAKLSTSKSPKTKKGRKEQQGSNDESAQGDESEKEWEVEKILKERKTKGGKKEYLIRWKGCKPTDDTWEPENQISCPEMIAKFAKRKKKM